MRDTSPHEPTDETRKKVAAMYGVGITQEDLCKFLGITEKTLRKYYRHELDTSLIKANAAIGGALYAKAKSGDTPAMIWWEKTRSGKSDKSTLDIYDKTPQVIKDNIPDDKAD